MAAYMFTSLPLPGTPTGEGYSLAFRVAGTNTPLAVYSDSNLGSAIAQPIVFNADGVPDTPIYMSSTPAAKIVYLDPDGVAVSGFPVDNFSPLEVGS